MMSWVSETKAIATLASIRARFSAKIRDYEKKARKCSECLNPGACCLDQHFVNVRISRLEAETIARTVAELDPALRFRVEARTRDVAEMLRVAGGGTESERTFACPLFEPVRGCLAHENAKPLACIAHACYERPEDLPPDELLSEAEEEVARLNERVYGNKALIKPIPTAVAERMGDRSRR